MLPTRKQSSSERREQREFYDLLRRSAEPGILSLNRSGVVTACNEAAARLLGRPCPAILGHAMEEGLPPPLPSLLRRVLDGGEHPVEQAVALEVPSGSHSAVWLNSFRASGDSEPDTQLWVTLHDLASARELETKTGRLQKLASVGLLSAGVAHEVKNALVAIKTYVDLLLETQPDSESAGLVRREVGRIDSLISQLLKFAGPARPNLGPAHVHAVLQDALRLVQPQMRSRRVEEVVLLQSPNDMVNGDSKQLEQAFLNLLLNAVEAMLSGGRLVVRTETVMATEHVSKFEPDRREPQIQIEIKDTGPGIPDEIANKLFTPFLTTKRDGTGLGLAITQRIVHEHHGRISVETKPGAGTVFRVLLPLLRPGE